MPVSYFQLQDMLSEQAVSSGIAEQALGVPTQSPMVQAHPRMNPQAIFDLAASHVRGVFPEHRASTLSQVHPVIESHSPWS